MDRPAEGCWLSLDLSLFAVFVFGCLYEPIVCRIEISPYRIDIGDDLGIVWIASLGLGRGIPCLANGALRRLQVWIICAQRDLGAEPTEPLDVLPINTPPAKIAVATMELDITLFFVMSKISCATFTGGDEGLAREKCGSRSDVAGLSRGNACYHLIEVNQRSSMATINRLPITKARINLGQIARRAHNGKEYFILEKDGIPVIGIMAADEMEDYIELRDAKVKSSIATSRRDRAAGKTRPVGKLLAELRRSAVRKTA